MPLSTKKSKLHWPPLFDSLYILPPSLPLYAHKPEQAQVVAKHADLETRSHWQYHLTAPLPLTASMSFLSTLGSIGGICGFPLTSHTQRLQVSAIAIGDATMSTDGASLLQSRLSMSSTCITSTRPWWCAHTCSLLRWGYNCRVVSSIASLVMTSTTHPCDHHHWSAKFNKKHPSQRGRSRQS
jgi:hypothetical protein